MRVLIWASLQLSVSNNIVLSSSNIVYHRSAEGIASSAELNQNTYSAEETRNVFIVIN